MLQYNNIGYLASGKLSAEGLEKISGYNTELYNEICDSYYPSNEKGLSPVKGQAKEAARLWEEAFGSLDDPEVKAKIDEVVRGINQIPQPPSTTPNLMHI